MVQSSVMDNWLSKSCSFDVSAALTSLQIREFELDAQMLMIFVPCHEVCEG